MAVEGFTRLGRVAVTFSTGENAFENDITFTDTPANLSREIQVQIYAASSSVLSIRLNGTDYPINNGTAVTGAVVFTILVDSTDTLNFRTDGTNIPLVIIVAGG